MTGRRGLDTAPPAAAHALAARVASAPWQVAPLYVVDVGEVAGAVRVMELNPFSGADLYECDARSAVEAVHRVALRLHAR